MEKQLNNLVEENTNDNQFDDVEGYAYCDSHKQRCLNDCSWPLDAHVFSRID